MTSAHFRTCALQQTPFLGTKIPFSTDSPRITGNIIVFPQKGWDPKHLLVPGKDAVLDYYLGIARHHDKGTPPDDKKSRELNPAPGARTL